MDNAMGHALPGKKAFITDSDLVSEEESFSDEELDGIIDYIFEDENFNAFIAANQEKAREKFLQVLEKTYYKQINTRLGSMYVAYKGNLLRFISLEDEATFLRKAKAYLGITPVNETYVEMPERLSKQIQSAINGCTIFTGSLDMDALTPWQQAVLERIRHIPRGEIRTFADIADELGKPGASAAVGCAMTHNPFPVLIPCHRVCHADKMLGKYAHGGVAVKKRLLLLEGVLIDDSGHVIHEKFETFSSRKPPFDESGALFFQADMLYPSLVFCEEQPEELTPWRRGLVGYIRWLIERYKNISTQQAFPHVTSLDFSAVYTKPHIVCSLCQDDFSGAQSAHEQGVSGLQMLVAQHTYAVLLGIPGSGKTMALRSLALAYALNIQRGMEKKAPETDELLIPIPLQLADYVQYGLREGKSLRDFFLFYFQKHGCPEDGLSELIDRLLERGGYIALLDGLDEVQDDALQRDLIQRINQFVDDTSGRTQFVVTSRMTGKYNELDGRFVPWRITGMETSDISEFLWNWHKVTNGFISIADVSIVQIERIQQEIDTLQHIIKLTHRSIRDHTEVVSPSITPLLVQIVTFVYYVITQRIHRRTELTPLIEKALQYTRETLSETMMHEYLASLLGKFVYLHYLSWHRKDRLQGGGTDDGSWQRNDKQPNTAIEEVVNALCGSASKSDTALNIREDVENLLAVMQQRTDEFIEPTRRILPAIVMQQRPDESVEPASRAFPAVI